MNKIINRMASVVLVLATILGSYSSASAAPGNVYDMSTTVNDANRATYQQAAFYKRLAPGNSAEWSIETSGVMEKVTPSADGWICEAGGYAAVTHYARLKYKIPERAGFVLTTFYMKAVIVLPADFYSQQNAGFRIMSTDNYTAILNGTSVGANDANESRTSVHIGSNHNLRVKVDHETISSKTLYSSPSPLPVGEHTLEFFGSLNAMAPWYLRIDGIVVASGIEMLSANDTAPNERVATRLVAGIDGAADQDANSMNLQVKSFEIANYDLAGITNSNPTPTPLSTTITSTPSRTPTQAATATLTSTLAPTLSQPTNTPTTVIVAATYTSTPSPLPSATKISTLTPTIAFTATQIPTQAASQPDSEKKYDDNLSDFIYSNGWEFVNKKIAYGGSFAQTSVNGSSVTFNFNGRSFSIFYRGGPKFGKMDVHLDGLLIGTINQKTSSNQYNLRWDYPVQFSQGLHTLKMVYVDDGTTNYGSLDAVVIR